MNLLLNNKDNTIIQENKKMAIKIHKIYFLSVPIFIKNLIPALRIWLKQKKKKESIKDTLFIFGSGYSINNISKKDWKLIYSKCDTLSFNYFYKCENAKMDYYLVREISSKTKIKEKEKEIKKFLNELLKSQNDPKTKFFFCIHPFSWDANMIFSKFRKKFKNKINVYSNNFINNNYKPPSKNILKIPHLGASLFDAVNIGYLLGYKKIVLAGIDLYDRRYFWLKQNESLEGDIIRNKSYKDIHNTAKPVINNLKKWNNIMLKKGVTMYIYNPKSLLKSFLPVYKKINLERRQS